MSQFLSPKKLLVSGSSRTRMTAETLISEFNISSSQVTYDDRIYDASVDSLYEVVTGTDNSIESLVLLGHNPGVSMFVRTITGASVSFPTASFVVIEFDSQSWAELTGGRIIAEFKP